MTGRPVATLVSIHRYPVKSLGGETLRRAHIGERGIPGDRAWAVRDEVRGGIRGAKRFAQLMTANARYPSEPVTQEESEPAEITFPDGRRLMTTDPEAGVALSTLVESPVTLWPLRPASDTAHYQRGAPVLENPELELRRVFARTPDEPLPDLSPLMRYESPPGTYFDLAPILIVTTNSLDALAAAGVSSRFDARRFRPNLLVRAASGPGFPERAWLEHRLCIGGAVLEAFIECPRCVMTTHGFADLPRDPKIMRTLVQEADGNLGLYAKVLEPGAVEPGDSVTLLN